MNVRRSAAVVAVLAATAGVGTGLGTGFAPAALADDTAPAAPSASPSQAIPTGLYGSTDPRYDGVWRQSLTLVALDAVGERPGAGAVEWLLGQQCASGAFAAYRPDPTAKCDAKTAVDTNSTAAAVQALAAVGGHDAEAGRAVGWLKDNQNDDGGWGFTAGGPSDANSTSVVIGALAAVGEKPDGQKKAGRSPYDALRALALPCAVGTEGSGAFAYQPDKKGGLAANADATAAAVLGSLGEVFVVDAGKAGEGGGANAGASGECAGGTSPEDAAHNGAVYLAGALTSDGYLKSALAGAEDQPDLGNTADAVVALAAAGETKAAGKPLAWLAKNHGPWAAKSGPAAYSQLILAAHATGTDPRDFGGADLVAQLTETGPARDVADHTGVPGDDTADGDENSGGVATGVVLGAGLGLAAIVGAALTGLTRKRRRP